MQPIYDVITITTPQAQDAVNICSGENGIDLSTVTQENWVQKRNQFLGNVQHNGKRSHNCIINVLLWFAQFE